MRYTEDELSALLERELRQSLGAPDSEIGEQRLRNLQYYSAEAVGDLAPPPTEGRSQVVASDCADTVNWMLPSLVRVFVQSQDSMECEAKRPEFAPAAKLASDYLRHVFWVRNEGFGTLYQMFKDALIQKVGFVKVYWDETPEDVEESYKGLLPEQVQEMLAAGDVEIVEQAQRQEMIQGQPVDLYDLRVKRTQQGGRCAIDPVPPEEMRIHSKARYGEDPVFLAHVYWRTRGELESEGRDLTDASAGAEWSSENIERARSQTAGWGDESEGELERFEVSECYIKLDQDEDGVPEWRRVVMIGGKVYEDEKVDAHPFVWYCPDPMPHVFFGNCPVDYAIQPQLLNTSLMRSVLDNVYLSVNQRVTVLDGAVQMSDLMNSRPGGVIRIREQGAVQPLVQGGLDPSAWQMVEWADQWRERRTGYTRNTQGLSADSQNPTATGISLVTEKADQRMELIARVAGESVRKIFVKMLKCMGQYQKVQDLVEIAGQWVSVDPREWAEGYRIKVNVGLGTGNKDRKAQAIMQVHAMQQPLAQAGALPPQAVIQACRDFAEAAGLAGPEKYFPDIPEPTGEPPPPPPEVQIEQMKLQADAQKFQAQIQADGQRMQAEAQADAQRVQSEAALKLQEVRASLELQQANDQRDAEREQLKAQYQMQLDQQRLELDKYKAQLQAQTQLQIAQMRQMPAEAPDEAMEAGIEPGQGIDSTSVLAASLDGFRAAIERMNAPRQIIRGPDGRAQGIV